MPTSSRSTGLEQILLERRTSNQNEEKELRKRKQKTELGIDRIIEEFDVSMLEKQTEIDEINRLYVTHASLPPPTSFVSSFFLGRLEGTNGVVFHPPIRVLCCGRYADVRHALLIRHIPFRYIDEKLQLSELEERLATIKVEYDIIMEERKRERDRREKAAEELAKMVKAALLMQKFWRAFKARKALKKATSKGGKKGKKKK